MKTPLTPHTILTLLTAVMLPLLASSVASAQSEEQSTNVVTAPSPGKCHHWHKALEALSPAEREQVISDMKKIHKDRELVTARQAVKEAQTPEAKIAAKKSLHQTRHDLLVKVDPSVAPILEKLKHHQEE